MSAPRVSIGMPVFNGAEHIAEAIESILAQSFTDFELIIADNGSEDGTDSICRGYAERDSRIRFIRHECNLGASRNFAYVFEQSRGRYFRWAAHDDVIAPEYLRRCVETLDRSGSNVVLCFPQRLLINADGQVLGPDGSPNWLETRPPYDRISFSRLMRVAGIAHPMFAFGLMRRDALAKTRLIGSYMHNDLVLVAELRLLGEFREIAEPLFYTRMHRETSAFAKLGKTSARTWRECYDPANIGKKEHPERTLFIERLKSVRLSGRPWYMKPWYYAWVVYGQLIVRLPPLWIKRPFYGIRQRLWELWNKISAASVRDGGKAYLPHRIWALLSGVKTRDRARIALAFARATPESHQALLEFVAQKLSRRDDRYARDVLQDWLGGSSPNCRSIAADAMQSVPRAECIPMTRKNLHSYLSPNTTHCAAQPGGRREAVQAGSQAVSGFAKNADN